MEAPMEDRISSLESLTQMSMTMLRIMNEHMDAMDERQRQAEEWQRRAEERERRAENSRDWPKKGNEKGMSFCSRCSKPWR